MQANGWPSRGGLGTGRQSDQDGQAVGKETGQDGLGWAGQGEDGQGRQDGQVAQAGRLLTVLEVEAVEVHPLHQVAQCLRFKGGEPRVADLPAGSR